MLLKLFDPNQVFEDETEDLRNYVFARDDGLCLQCGSQGSSIHHVIYRSHMKGHCANRMGVLCFKCHFSLHNCIDVEKKLLLLRIEENEKKLRERLV